MSWEKVKLEDLCTMQSGGTPSRNNENYYKGDIPWAKISDIETSNDGIVYKTEESISIEGLKSINNRLFEKGTLLLAMYGSVGKVAISGIRMSTNQAILGIKIIDESKLDYSYLRYWFQTIKEQLVNRAVGGTLQNISLGIVKDLEIPLPPIDTQKRIAEILDAADALRRKDQELLKKYDELAQAIFIDMFGDPVKNEKGWEKVAISHYIKRLDTGVSVNSNDEDVNLTKNCVLKTSCVYTGYFAPNEAKVIVKEEINRARLNPVKDSIIISRMNTSELVGMSAYINKDYPNLYLPDRLWMTVKSNNYHSSLWLSFALKSLAVREQILKIASGTSGSMKNISKKDFLNIQLINPPFDLQKKFEVALSVINSSKEFSVNFKSYLLFNSLLQKAFKGELVA